MTETFLERQKRAVKILHTLQKHNPTAHIALIYGNDIQLLVAVILSAQCTDKKVNEVTRPLFRKYKMVKDFATADPKIFEQEIKSTGFYRAKAKNIIGAAKIIQTTYKGVLPHTMEEILTLPGVGRKTANIVLGNAFGIVEGIPVDTHVRRLSRHFGWTTHTDPDKIEQDLMKLLPRQWWATAPYLLIDYGRSICTARKCGCGESYIKKLVLYNEEKR